MCYFSFFFNRRRTYVLNRNVKCKALWNQFHFPVCVLVWLFFNASNLSIFTKVRRIGIWYFVTETFFFLKHPLPHCVCTHARTHTHTHTHPHTLVSFPHSSVSFKTLILLFGISLWPSSILKWGSTSLSLLAESLMRIKLFAWYLNSEKNV